jgi:hypothetical protein
MISLGTESHFRKIEKCFLCALLLTFGFQGLILVWVGVALSLAVGQSNYVFIRDNDQDLMHIQLVA